MKYLLMIYANQQTWAGFGPDDSCGKQRLRDAGADSPCRLRRSGPSALPRCCTSSAVRAHLLEMDGDTQGARQAYLIAARRTTSAPEKRYLEARAARLSP
jgi:hypothetical protein